MNKYITLIAVLFIAIGCKDSTTKPVVKNQTSQTSTFIQIETGNGYKYEVKKRLNGEVSGVKLNGEDAAFFETGQDSILVRASENQLPTRNTVSITVKNSEKVETATFVGRPKEVKYTVAKKVPHNPRNFTQGLLFEDGILYESTGLEGRSRILKYKRAKGGFVEDGDVRNKINEFGEGIGFMGDKLVQLLWKNGYIKIYNKADMKHLMDVPYANEGWGVTVYNDQLYVSDGSAAISVINIDQKVVRKVFELPVQDHSGGIKNINELEVVKGKIFANVWQTNNIVIIDPNDGLVEGIINLADLMKQERSSGNQVDVLNGIAYDEKTNEIWVTGKMWQYFYKLELDDFM